MLVGVFNMLNPLISLLIFCQIPIYWYQYIQECPHWEVSIVQLPTSQTNTLTQNNTLSQTNTLTQGNTLAQANTMPTTQSQKSTEGFAKYWGTGPAGLLNFKFIMLARLIRAMETISLRLFFFSLVITSNVCRSCWAKFCQNPTLQALLIKQNQICTILTKHNIKVCTVLTKVRLIVAPSA